MKRLKSKKITDSAKGEDCTIRIPGVCNHNPETTVAAHYRMNGMSGAGLKPHDTMIAYACSDCHAVVDGQKKTTADKEYLRNWHAEGVFKTQQILIEKGLIKIA